MGIVGDACRRAPAKAGSREPAKRTSARAVLYLGLRMETVRALSAYRDREAR
jgi:hypothetical protein